jgi:hypothetical protein
MDTPQSARSETYWRLGLIFSFIGGLSAVGTLSVIFLTPTIVGFINFFALFEPRPIPLIVTIATIIISLLGLQFSGISAKSEIALTHRKLTIASKIASIFGLVIGAFLLLGILTFASTTPF